MWQGSITSVSTDPANPNGVIVNVSYTDGNTTVTESYEYDISVQMDVRTDQLSRPNPQPSADRIGEPISFAHGVIYS